MSKSSKDVVRIAVIAVLAIAVAKTVLPRVPGGDLLAARL